MSAPRAYGGWAAPAAVARRTAEILAGACCSTWFVQTRHHTPVATPAAAEGSVRERLLGPPARGELMSGVAYAHVRAYPRTPCGPPGSATDGGSTGRWPGTPAGV